MALVYVTRRIPESGIALLRANGHEVVVSEKDGALTEDELIRELRGAHYDAVLCLLHDTINAAVFKAAPTVRIFANYAVGYNNIDVEEARRLNVAVTNTPGVLTETVAEFTIALMLAVVKRIPEGDRFIRAGSYEGWAPQMLLGTDVRGKTFGILGAGRIGYECALHAFRGFGMEIVYNDITRNEPLEKETGARFRANVDEVLSEADVVSIHVPLNEHTHHLLDARRIALMKQSAYLINTSRGGVIDERALVDALANNRIRGAGLDVFEYEPALSEGLSQLPNVVLTPHIASASEETRSKMSEIAAHNIIAFFEGKPPANSVA